MLSAYLLEPATWIAVLIPALITLWALLSSPLSPSQWRAWGISTVLAMLCARWDISEDVHQLFIIPVVLFWIAGSLLPRELLGRPPSLRGRIHLPVGGGYGASGHPT